MGSRFVNWSIIDTFGETPAVSKWEVTMSPIVIIGKPRCGIKSFISTYRGPIGSLKLSRS